MRGMVICQVLIQPYGPTPLKGKRSQFGTELPLHPPPKPTRDTPHSMGQCSSCLGLGQGDQGDSEVCKSPPRLLLLPTDSRSLARLEPRDISSTG